MHINYVAVLCAALAAWVFGAIWYTALAAPWKAALGWTAEQIKTTKAQIPVGPMILSFIAELVMAAMLALFLRAFEQPTIAIGAVVGAHCWLGFVITTIAVNNAYASRKIALTVIDSAHWLGVLVIEGIVLGAMR